jgi:hypothetical protein
MTRLRLRGRRASDQRERGSAGPPHRTRRGVGAVWHGAQKLSL